MQKIIIALILAVFFIMALIVFDNIDKFETNEIKPEKTNELKFEKINPIKTQQPKEIKTPFEINTNVPGLKITITKITNTKFLKIFATYENNTVSVYHLTESLCKIVADGKQQQHNIIRRFDFDDNAVYDLESNASCDSVLVFDKIKSNLFDLIWNVNYENIRIYNVLVN
jgi:hypothetical protein